MIVVLFLMPGTSAADDAVTGQHAARYLVLNATAHWIATAFEVGGVLAILVVAIAATIRFGRALAGSDNWNASLTSYRADLGRGVLLGLELLVAADIVGTVAIAPTFGNLGVLAIVILIRTFLSISLGVEIEGRWPWRRRDAEGPGKKP